MAVPDEISVRVVYALPDRQSVVALRVPASSTVRDAVIRSGLLARYEEATTRPLECAVFGRVVKLDEGLRDGDRIEILRPLIVDPKQARRQAHDGHPLGRDCESRSCLPEGLQRIGRFAKVSIGLRIDAGRALARDEQARGRQPPALLRAPFAAPGSRDGDRLDRHLAAAELRSSPA